MNEIEKKTKKKIDIIMKQDCWNHEQSMINSSIININSSINKLENEN